MKKQKNGELTEFYDKATGCLMYSRFEEVYYISISVAARLTGRDRATVRNAIRSADLYPEKGPRNAELYKSYQIFRAIATGRG